jgi:hypothetical protein
MMRTLSLIAAVLLVGSLAAPVPTLAANAQTKESPKALGPILVTTRSGSLAYEDGSAGEEGQEPEPQPSPETTPEPED